MLLQAVAIEQDDDFAYIASPLCEYNLEELIEKKPCQMMLTDNQRIEICTSLLNAVCDLHNLDILHRDIKPRNVLIGKNCMFSFEIVFVLLINLSHWELYGQFSQCGLITIVLYCLLFKKLCLYSVLC